MKLKILLFCLLYFSCNTGNLVVVFDIPKTLNEVSGLEFDTTNNFYWMINDRNNKPILYALDSIGKIVKEVKINAKNHDWEDLATDKKGNIFIGDFGNNANIRKDLTILKVNKDSLKKSGKIDVGRISFFYPEQNKFPPKRKKMHFDSESFIFYNESLYIFTKSRTSDNYGITNLYKIPATSGHHKAQFIGSFTTCEYYGCWVTSADITEDGKKVVLLTEHSVYVFTEYENDHFFSGKVNSYSFDHLSQKESVDFKNDSTLYIADERTSGKGGYLYEFQID